MYKIVGCVSNFCDDLLYKLCMMSCQYDYLYGDGLLMSGVLFVDMVIIGMGMIFNVVFGCGYSNLGMFVGVGGLVGFG